MAPVGGDAAATVAGTTPACMPNASTVAALATIADNHFRGLLPDIFPTVL